MILSVVIITQNEELNLARTLESVKPLVADGKGEIIIVDSGSTDRTVEIAESFGAKVFVEEWKGYAAQKNSAIEKATGDWILSLDADEEVESTLVKELVGHPTDQPLPQMSPREWCLTMEQATNASANLDMLKGRPAGFSIRRKNFFLGRWIQHGGFWPDPKLRLFRQGHGRCEARSVHEIIHLHGRVVTINCGSLIHHSYPTLSDYIEHMNRYSSLGAEMVVAKGKGKVRFSVINIALRPLATFVYNYFFRLGFLDGREGLLLHLYHAVYVSWKYAKAWELSRKQS
ncbi:MAG: glycosyltransferase family 2 protein [Acidobacteriia bacterium]|nr:glycosyltransferase family 2 protein [Terriglobia bacterium]